MNMENESASVEPAGKRTLLVPELIVLAMIGHARRTAPEECCGLLAGIGERVSSLYPLVNEAADPRCEFLVTAGLVGPFKQMRFDDEEILAVYHSHPNSPAIP